MARRIAFFDCFSGVSGDMVLSAMVDAGLEVEALRSELAKLHLAGWRLEADRVARQGLAGTHVRVTLEDRDPPSRRLPDIEEMIGSSGLTTNVQERAVSIFRALAEAEATVHGVGIEEVHFHEVGAIDALIDIVGASIGLELLGIEKSYASSLPVGLGSVKTAHGTLPLPAPATLALVTRAQAPLRPAAQDVELVTPTGAAILTTCAEFAQPPLVVEAVGTGFGTRELPWPNVLRLWVGTAAEDGLEDGEIAVIETNLDDESPEQLAFAMERLFEAGALDVFFTPAQMKKNRPGVILTVLAAPAQARDLAHLVLKETTSLGVRFRSSRRLVCPRRSETLATAFGLVQVKIKQIDGQEFVSPEYEDCARVAREHGVPIAAVYAAVNGAGIARHV